MNIAFTGVATLLFYFFYHPPTFEMLHTKRTLKQTLKTLDLIGLVLVASGLTLFLMGISWGGQSYPWKSGQVLGTLLGGLGLMVAFAVYGMVTDLSRGRIVLTGWQKYSFPMTIRLFQFGFS